MGLEKCMSRLSESKAISQSLKMDSTSCSYNSGFVDWTHSYEGDELAEFKEELGESDEDGPDSLKEEEPVEFLLDSMSGVGVISD